MRWHTLERVPPLARIVKSIRNRVLPLAMRLRGSSTRVLMPGIISGGAGISLGRGVELAIYGDLVVGANVILSDGCALQVGPGARLLIGDRVFVGRGSVIAAQQSVEIGADTLIAEHCTVRDQDHQLDPEKRLRLIETQAVTGPVKL